MALIERRSFRSWRMAQPPTGAGAWISCPPGMLSVEEGLAIRNASLTSCFLCSVGQGSTLTPTVPSLSLQSLAEEVSLMFPFHQPSPWLPLSSPIAHHQAWALSPAAVAFPSTLRKWNTTFTLKPVLCSTTIWVPGHFPVTQGSWFHHCSAKCILKSQPSFLSSCSPHQLGARTGRG